MNNCIKMSLSKITTFLLILSLLTGCGNDDANNTTNENSIISSSINTPSENASDRSDNMFSPDKNNSDNSATDNSTDYQGIIASDYETINVVFKKKDANSDYELSKCTLIEFNESSATISGANSSAVVVNTANSASSKADLSSAFSNVSENASDIPAVQAIITVGGDYLISGKCNDGQILVAADTSEDVRLILNNAEINCKNSAPILEQSCDKLIVTLASDSINNLSDNMPAKISSNEENSNNDTVNISNETLPDSTVYAKNTISINGAGTLNIISDNNQGIHSKDDIKLVSGNIVITAGSHGIKGKDSVIVKDAIVTITSKGDGIKSTNTDEGTGFVVIQNGSLTISSEQDGISAKGKVEITGGKLDITTKSTASSSKAIKAENTIYIADSEINTVSTDDAIHSDTDILIMSGNLSISSDDDGLHADSSITIEDGIIEINKSYEGIESEVIYINGGNIRIYSNDDGINASSPRAEGTVEDRGNFGGQRPDKGNLREWQFEDNEMPERNVFDDKRPNESGFSGERPEESMFNNNQPDGDIIGNKQRGFGNTNISSNATLHINGGNIYVNANGDGLDSNGTMYINGGVTLVDGPTNSGNSAIDHDGEAYVNGGVIVGSGSSGMIELFSTESAQNVLMIYFNKSLEVNTEIKISNGSEQILSFTNGKSSQCAMISTPKLITGETYTVTANNEEICSVKIESTITSNGNSTGFNKPGGKFRNFGDRTASY